MLQVSRSTVKLGLLTDGVDALTYSIATEDNEDHDVYAVHVGDSDMDAETLLAHAPFRGILRLPAEDHHRHPVGTIVLAHAFGVVPRAYSSLADEWAKDGWAVYIPQLYSVFEPAGEEVPALACAARFVHDNVRGPIVLAGHSRGGQAALLLLLRLAGKAGTLPDSSGSLPATAAVRFLGSDRKDMQSVRVAPPLQAFRGLLLLDPVEGRHRCFSSGLRHLILESAGLDWAWPQRLPVLIVGCRRGGDGCAPAAPRGHNYEAIYSALRAATPTTAPAGAEEFSEDPFFVCEVRRFGHMDFLDDPRISHGLIPAMAWTFCPGELGERGVLRDFTRRVTTMVFGEGDKRGLAGKLCRTPCG